MCTVEPPQFAQCNPPNVRSGTLPVCTVEPSLCAQWNPPNVHSGTFSLSTQLFQVCIMHYNDIQKKGYWAMYRKRMQPNMHHRSGRVDKHSSLRYGYKFQDSRATRLVEWKKLRRHVERTPVVRIYMHCSLEPFHMYGFLQRYCSSSMVFDTVHAVCEQIEDEMAYFWSVQPCSN